MELPQSPPGDIIFLVSLQLPSPRPLFDQFNAHHFSQEAVSFWLTTHAVYLALSSRFYLYSCRTYFTNVP